MKLRSEKVVGIKVVNISEESNEAIEKMANDSIAHIYEKNLKILDIQVTDDNLFFILGENKD